MTIILLLFYSIAYAGDKNVWCEYWGQHLTSPNGRYEIWLKPYGECEGDTLYFLEKESHPKSPKVVWEHPHRLRAAWSPDSKWIVVDDSMHFDGHLLIFGIKGTDVVQVFQTQHDYNPKDYPAYDLYYEVTHWTPKKNEVIIKITNRGTALPEVRWRRVRLRTP